MAQVYRVVRAHDPGPGEPLLVKKGDVVAFERRQTKWDGWLWCWRPTGQSGWVSEAWVRIDGDTAVMKRDYSALELTVQPGELLEAVLEESGWLLATSSQGTTGWMPLEQVELVEPDVA